MVFSDIQKKQCLLAEESGGFLVIRRLLNDEKKEEDEVIKVKVLHFGALVIWLFLHVGLQRSSAKVVNEKRYNRM